MMSPAEFAEVKAMVLTMWLVFAGGLGISFLCVGPFQMTLSRTLAIALAWECAVFALFYAGAFH